MKKCERPYWPFIKEHYAEILIGIYVLLEFLSFSRVFQQLIVLKSTVFQVFDADLYQVRLIPVLLATWFNAFEGFLSFLMYLIAIASFIMGIKVYKETLEQPGDRDLERSHTILALIMIYIGMSLIKALLLVGPILEAKAIMESV